MSIQVRCPNPDCRKVYAVQDHYAGQRGKCPECGARIAIPTAQGAKSKIHRDGEVHADPHLREVRVGCIGRGHAGKTALFHALGEGIVGDFLPSGLHVDAADPREVAQMIREAEEMQRLLQLSGLPPTLDATQIRYCIYDGDEQRIVYRMREVVGQVLTHTLPNSSPDFQARYARYLKNLVNTQVLWVVVPCPPPDPGHRDRRRYANDLRITMAYLREALRLRSRERPVGVALVLSKIDALFENPEEARATLTDDVLRGALAPLVQLIDKSAHVSDAAIFPVTAFGFGNAVLRDEGGTREGVPAEIGDDPFSSEPIWLLREGMSPRPFNLGALFLWTTLLGVLTQQSDGAEQDPEMATVCRKLGGDLESAEPWAVPLKGGIELAAPADRAASIRP